MLSVPSVTVTGAGTAAGEGTLQNQAGAEIVLTKWIGMEGMLRIAEEREEELRQRFAPVFLRQIQSYRDEIFAGKELETARQAGITTVRQVAEGGIFAALWELSKETGMGLDLDMKQICFWLLVVYPRLDASLTSVWLAVWSLPPFCGRNTGVKDCIQLFYMG